MNIQFILASQSPRRRELLGLLNLPFQVRVANADEDSVTYPDPTINVIETARLKARIVAKQYDHTVLGEKLIILAADTTVALDREMLNKPANETAAFQMLTALRGSKHEVHTGFVLLDVATGQEWQGVSTAVVTMRPYSNAEINAYIATGDPFDKAGAYAIQHPTFQPVTHLAGCYCNVMGLPICDLIVGIRQFIGSKDPFATLNLTAVAQAHNQYPCPTLEKLQQAIS